MLVNSGVSSCRDSNGKQQFIFITTLGMAKGVLPRVWNFSYPALSSSAGHSATNRKMELNRCTRAGSMTVSLPQVYRGHQAGIWKALLFFTPCKDRESISPGSSILSLLHIYLTDGKTCRVIPMFRVTFCFTSCLSVRTSWVSHGILLTSDNYHFVLHFLDFTNWYNIFF